MEDLTAALSIEDLTVGPSMEARNSIFSPSIDHEDTIAACSKLSRRFDVLNLDQISYTPSIEAENCITATSMDHGDPIAAHCTLTNRIFDSCMEPTNMDEDKPSSNIVQDQTNQNDNQNIPKVGMMFDSEDELYYYFKKYAYQIGFGVRKVSTRTKGERATTYYSLGCAKEGVYAPETKRAGQLSTKTGCKPKICVIACSDGICAISHAFLDHNHALNPKKSRFQRSHKKMDSYAKRRLELNDYAGIPLNKSFHLLVFEAKGYDNFPFGETDCRNYIAKVRQLRLGIRDAEALHDYFVHMQRRSPKIFYVIDIDDEGRLRNVFWADARSRAAYKSLGDVSFDIPYLTNKYSMPFAPFVGVNHHGRSILFGCHLLSRKDTDMYVWLFKSWLECMNGRPPKAIITNQ